MQQFKTLCRHGGLKGGKTSEVTAGMTQALNKANLDRIGPERKDNRDGLGGGLGRYRRRGRIRYRNDAYVTPNQIGNQFRNSFEMPLRITEFDRDVSALGVASFGQPSAEIIQIFGSIAGRPAA